MFEKLKKIFSETAKNLGKKSISKKEIDSILDDLQINLMENDVAHEIVEEMTSTIKMEMLDLKLEGNEKSDELIATRLYTYLRDLFLSSNNKINIIQSILEKKKSKAGPYSIIFLGINGTGKTTTIAKFCKMLRDHGISVVLAAGDTHRAGAIEQIMYHGNNLNVKVISQRYGADPSAVARDALEHAKKNYVEAVMIDTAGRMQTSKNLMEEVSKIIRVIKPDLRIFVGDSLAGNDTVNQAREFFEYTNFDGSILTKSDADSRGGAAISITYLTHKPILYLGVGQGYDDLEEFDHERFLNSIFKDRAYEKSTNEQPQEHASNPDTSSINDLTENVIMDSRTDTGIAQITNKDPDKYMDEKEAISTPPTVMSDAKEIGNQDQLITEQFNNDKGFRKGEISKETSETKPKKGSFFKKLFKDVQENDLDDSNVQSQTEIRGRRDKNKEKAESKNESEEVVYLTDDDINDLLK